MVFYRYNLGAVAVEPTQKLLYFSLFYESSVLSML